MVRILLMSTSGPQGARNKPLKRPTQDRARVTVQAIFDSYVRIWQRDGWERVTTRAVALEAGVATGTFYDYFPSKMALHSGYVRHCIERTLAAIEEEAVSPPSLAWEERVSHLVRILGGVSGDLPWFHPQMVELEPAVADARHQQRAYRELLGAWQRVVTAAGLPHDPDSALVESLHLMVWGARRYALQVALPQSHVELLVEEQVRICLCALATE